MGGAGTFQGERNGGRGGEGWKGGEVSGSVGDRGCWWGRYDKESEVRSG